MKMLAKIMLALPILACLSLPSCSTVKQARHDIRTMDQIDYDALRGKVFGITAIASHRIAMEWDADKKDEARAVVIKGRALIQGNKAEELAKLDATSLIRALAKKYGEQLGLDQKAMMDIQDAALLVDVVVGPIKLKIDGTLDERERGLILVLLQGLEVGLQ